MGSQPEVRQWSREKAGSSGLLLAPPSPINITLYF